MLTSYTGINSPRRYGDDILVLWIIRIRSKQRTATVPAEITAKRRAATRLRIAVRADILGAGGDGEILG